MQTGQKLIYVTFLGLLLATLVLSNSQSVAAGADARIAPSAAETKPLKPGQKAPAFTVRTVDDQPFVFDPDELERPTVLITFRGGWCPYCNMHLSELANVVPQIREKGIDILFLSGDRPELLYSSLKRETREDIDGLDYTILSDASLDAAMALGIAFRVDDAMIDRFAASGTDIDGSSMNAMHALPVPAVYVIDRDGTITYSFVEPDYRIRLPAKDLLGAAMEVSH